MFVGLYLWTVIECIPFQAVIIIDNVLIDYDSTFFI